MFTLFKCTIPSSKYYFKNGSCAYFTNGRFATKTESEIEELMAEIKSGHPHIYIDDKEKETSAAIEDPMSALKKKIIEEFLASKCNEVDMGSTGAGVGEGTGIATSSTQAIAARISQSKTK